MLADLPSAADDRWPPCPIFDLAQWPPRLVQVAALADPGLVQHEEAEAIKACDAERFGRWRCSDIQPEFVQFVDTLALGQEMLDEGYELLEVDGEQWYVLRPRADHWQLSMPVPTARYAVQEVGSWSDELVAAIADQHPDVFRSEELTYAISEKDLLAWTLWCVFDGSGDDPRVERHLDYERCQEHIAAQMIRLVADDGVWYLQPRYITGSYQSPYQHELQDLGVQSWPDDLIAAVGKQLPMLIRSCLDMEDAYAIAVEDVERHYKTLGQTYSPDEYRRIDAERSWLVALA